MNAAEIVREALWPRRVICLCCQRLSRGAHLCMDCREQLKSLRIEGSVCEICGHPLTEGQCTFCDRTGIVTLRAAWVYGDQARELILLLKHGAVADAAQVLADGMARRARTMSLSPDTVVTWPTMPRHRRLERGIDHGAQLAEAVGDRLGLPVRQLLTRSETIAARTQVGLSRTERLARLQGAFSCDAPPRCHVLLVDDVLTTSATATTCAECLLDAGAYSVNVITAAQAVLPHRNGKEGYEHAGT